MLFKHTICPKDIDERFYYDFWKKTKVFTFCNEIKLQCVVCNHFLTSTTFLSNPHHKLLLVRQERNLVWYLHFRKTTASSASLHLLSFVTNLIYHVKNVSRRYNSIPLNSGRHSVVPTYMPTKNNFIILSVTKKKEKYLIFSHLLHFSFALILFALRFMGLYIAIRNGKIVWKVVWIEYYLRLSLSSRRY